MESHAKDAEENAAGNETPKLPLAAKDSEWVGIEFAKAAINGAGLNNNANAPEQVIRTYESDERETLPLLVLFPNLRDVDDDLSALPTSDVTKLIAGTDPQFARMRVAKRLSPKQAHLDPLTEQAEDEPDSINTTDFSDRDARSRPYNANNTDASDPYDVEVDEEDLKPRHKKRRKTRSDLTAVETTDSSHYELKPTAAAAAAAAMAKTDGVPSAEKRPLSRSRLLSREFSRPAVVTVPSSQESFGDDESERDESKS